MLTVLLYSFLSMLVALLLNKIFEFVKIRIVVAFILSLIALLSVVVYERVSVFHTILCLLMLLSIFLKIIQDIVVFKIRKLNYVKYVSFGYYFGIYTMCILYTLFSLFLTEDAYILHNITLRIIAFVFVVGSLYCSFDLVIFMRKMSKVIKSLTYSNFEGLCEKLEIHYKDEETKIKKQKKAKEGDEIEGKRAILMLTLERLIDKNKVNTVHLSNTDIYFNPDFLNTCKSLAEDISKSDVRVDKNIAINSIKETLSLPDNLLSDFFIIENDNIKLHEFDDGDFYVNDIHIDKIVVCASCGKAKLSSMMENIEGEWFCSDICEETENLCYKIAYDKDFGEKPIEESISDGGAIGVASVGAAQYWNEQARVLSFSTNENGEIIRKGHGIAAERANDFIDRLKGKDAKILGDDNAKDGADRIVDGIKIQSKYCANAQKSVSEAFGNDGKYRYMDNGKPMQLEVPKDQYEAAVKEMEKRIENGEVQGITDPNEAKNIIKEGDLTYIQAINTTKFGTIESLQYDFRKGVIIGFSAGGISFALNTAITYWRTKDMKLAIKSSAIIGIKTAGKSAAIFMVSSQMQRIPKVKLFLDKAININLENIKLRTLKVGQVTKGNLTDLGYSPLPDIADLKNPSKLIEKAKEATEAKVGRKPNHEVANRTLRGAAVAAASTIAVTSTIEIIRMARGRISGMQCIKNIVVSASGVTGGTIGGLVGGVLLSPIPIVGPIVGSFVGGAVGGMVATTVAKTVMDEFIVDDTVAMMEIVTRHLEYLASNFLLSDEEMKLLTNEVDAIITQNKAFLEDVFASSYRRAFVNSKLKPIVVRIIKDRAKIPYEALEEQNIIDVIAEEVPA